MTWWESYKFSFKFFFANWNEQEECVLSSIATNSYRFSFNLLFQIWIRTGCGSWLSFKWFDKANSSKNSQRAADHDPSGSAWRQFSSRQNLYSRHSFKDCKPWFLLTNPWNWAHRSATGRMALTSVAVKELRMDGHHTNAISPCNGRHRFLHGASPPKTVKLIFTICELTLRYQNGYNTDRWRRRSSRSSSPSSSTPPQQ